MFKHVINMQDPTNIDFRTELNSRYPNYMLDLMRFNYMCMEKRHFVKVYVLNITSNDHQIDYKQTEDEH